jgi:hypothetical protein
MAPPGTNGTPTYGTPGTLWHTSATPSKKRDGFVAWVRLAGRANVKLW